MFIGHFALGFAAKKATPKTSLATLFVAAELADIIWPILLALGIERVVIAPGTTAFTPVDFVSYPFSHSLLMLVVWGALFGGLYFARTRNSRGALIIALLVVSHWVLDWITHRPDMPLYPGGPKLGLGMWNSISLTMTVELVMFAVGVAIYARSTRARDAKGRWAFWALVAVLLQGYFFTSRAGPPPSVQNIWRMAFLGTVVTVALAWWADRHRTTGKLSGWHRVA